MLLLLLKTKLKLKQIIIHNETEHYYTVLLYIQIIHNMTTTKLMRRVDLMYCSPDYSLFILADRFYLTLTSLIFWILWQISSFEAGLNDEIYLRLIYLWTSAVIVVHSLAEVALKCVKQLLERRYLLMLNYKLTPSKRQTIIQCRSQNWKTAISISLHTKTRFTRQTSFIGSAVNHLSRDPQVI